MNDFKCFKTIDNSITLDEEKEEFPVFPDILNFGSIWEHEEKENISFGNKINKRTQSKQSNHTKIEKIDNKNESYIPKFISIKKYRGKKRNKTPKYNRIHLSQAQDNIFIKIHVHYLSFIISFLNDLLRIYDYKYKLLNLSYDFKKKINKELFEKMKKQTLGDIICEEITKKNNKDSKYNINIYNIIKKNEDLHRILSDNYINVFKKFYLKSNKIISLKEYKIDKVISLSNRVKMFKDLLLKNKGKNINNNYLRNISLCIKQKFVNNLLFMIK